jgi:type I restriction enzyme M protein
VDTFEEQEDIDLAAVAAKLSQCDRDMVAVDEVIKGFCDELGIDAPL